MIEPNQNMVQIFKLSDKDLKKSMINILEDPVGKMENFIKVMETIFKKVKWKC